MRQIIFLLLLLIALGATAQINSLKDDASNTVAPAAIRQHLSGNQRLYPVSFISRFRPIRSAPSGDLVFIDFVGNGDIQKSISEAKDISANTGLGIIFERFHGFSKTMQSFELESYLNLFSTADTLTGTLRNQEISNRRSFGAYILNPVSSRQSIFVNANLYFGYPNDDDVTSVKDIEWSKLSHFGRVATFISGLNARFIASNNVWVVGDTVRNLGAHYFRMGCFTNLFRTIKGSMKMEDLGIPAFLESTIPLEN